MTSLRLLFCIVAFAFLVLGLLFIEPGGAQVAGGTILGTISDSTGANVPNATILIKNTANDLVRSLSTNDQGIYRTPDLIPGTYQITVSAPGFATVVRNDVTLTVGMEVVINVQLRVGSVNEKIEINAETPSVETSTSTISGAVDGTTVRELPLNARDWTALASLEPGVTTVRTQVAAASGFERSNRGFGTQLAVGGNRPQQNSYRLDGASINDYTNGGPGSVLGGVLGVDAIQEFSIVTSNATAEYGRTSGGVINAVTRSGTNAFHGSAYEFLRNSALDASNFFDITKPPFRRNQFGGTAGGPIRKGRTFIFGDYEGLRQTLNVTQRSTVPSVAARSGQLTTGNVTVNPKVAPYLAIFPQPNGLTTGDFATFTFALPQISHENFYTARVDNMFSQKDNFSATYFFDDSKTTNPDVYNFVLMASISRRQLATLGETHAFTPNVLNSSRFAFSRVVSQAPRTLSAINPLAKDSSLGFLPAHNVGIINVAGLPIFPGGLGATGEFDYHYNSFQVYDDVFATKGIHSLTMGGYVERIQANQLGQSNPSGNFTFGSLSNFLTNKPRSFNAALSGLITPRDLRQTILAFYFQDDVHLRSNFSFNLGIRYEMSTVPTETTNKLSNLRNATDTKPFLGSPYFSNPTLRNFEPRVGFSWDPFHDGKTAVRAAFGIYDVLPLTYQFELLSILSAPFFERGNISGLAPGSFPTGAFPLLGPNRLRFFHLDPDPARNYVMQWNLNVQRQLAANLSAQISYVGSRGVHQPFRVDDMNIVLPVGRTSQGYFWPTPAGSGKTLNPNLGQISGLFWNDTSSYHAMQLRILQRMKHGLQFGGSYTWSKSIDEGSASLAGDPFLNSITSLPFFDPKLRRGLSDFDVRNLFVVNYIWQIPGPSSGVRFLRLLAGGWETGGIYVAGSGLPFTAILGGDPLGLLSSDAAGTEFPDRVAGPGCQSLVNPGTPNSYIKTQCFAFPNPSTRLGNAGRNTLEGPGLSNFDVSLFKNNRIPRISETFNAQFRMEFFNVLNHPNFAPPLHNNTIFDTNGNRISTAGLVDTTATPSRQIQFGLKLIW
jgi:Carboxypeptidase regulatory-like domain/TonB-dependent Receptor Plug Domain/TonB dependent receptor